MYITLSYKMENRLLVVFNNIDTTQLHTPKTTHKMGDIHVLVYLIKWTIL